MAARNRERVPRGLQPRSLDQDRPAIDAEPEVEIEPAVHPPFPHRASPRSDDLREGESGA